MVVVQGRQLISFRKQNYLNWLLLIALVFIVEIKCKGYFIVWCACLFSWALRWDWSNFYSRENFDNIAFSMVVNVKLHIYVRISTVEGFYTNQRFIAVSWLIVVSHISIFMAFLWAYVFSELEMWHFI